jgi:hypothetical protein
MDAKMPKQSAEQAETLNFGAALISATPHVTPATPVTGIADELAKLASLRDLGVLSADEFDAEKAKLLAWIHRLTRADLPS